MSQIRVYIKPFDDVGNYLSFIEVTEDVDINALGTFSRDIDSTEYNAGLFKYSNITLKLNNEHGKYSDIYEAQSIFKYKRADSIVKITWSPNPGDQFHTEHSYMVDDTTVFEGLLNDESTAIDLQRQEIRFVCLGYESLLDKMEVPYSSLSAGDTIDEVLFTCLNQAVLTDHITVSAGNIGVDTNSVTDSVADLENKTVKEAVDDLLILGNAVMKIEGGVLYVSPRTESASLMYTFYGQASPNGIENISNLTNIKNGMNRVFNLWTWQDSTNASREASSIDKWGVRKKEISSDLITNSGKKDTILAALKDEFGNPKQELELTTPIKKERLDLALLDKVTIDYPTVVYSADGNALPVWGSMVWGSFVWPIGVWSLTLDTNTNWKILGIKVNLKQGEITYKLREV